MCFHIHLGCSVRKTTEHSIHLREISILDGHHVRQILH